MRLGQPHAVDGRPLPAVADHGHLQLGHAAGAHRQACCRTWPGQRRGPDAGRQRLRRGPRVGRPRRVRRDVRTRAQPPRAAAAHQHLAAPRRGAVRARVRPPRAAVPVHHRGEPGRLDGAALLHGRGDAQPRPVPAPAGRAGRGSRWAVDGTHYSRTLEAWLERLDDGRARVLQLFADTYGTHAAEAWYHRWRVFTLACSELFAFDSGTEWHVTHTRMRPRPA